MTETPETAKQAALEAEEDRDQAVMPAEWTPAVRDAFWTAVNSPTYEESTSATLAFAQLLTAPADRAAVLREAADFYDRLLADMGAAVECDPHYWQAIRRVAVELRRMADETQQPEGEPTESVIYQVVGDWGVDSADSAEGARAAVAKWLRAYPKCGAFAQQRICRDWPDGSEFSGPWTDLPEPPAAVQQPKEA